MKQLGPSRRKPPQKTDFLPVILALVLAMLSLALIAYCLRDAGIVSGQTFLLILFLIVAIAGAVFVVLDSDRQPPGAALQQYEVPPPPDVYLIWPPDGELPEDKHPATGRAENGEPPEGKPPGLPV